MHNQHARLCAINLRIFQHLAQSFWSRRVVMVHTHDLQPIDDDFLVIQQPQSGILHGAQVAMMVVHLFVILPATK